MASENKTTNWFGLAQSICTPNILPPQTDELPLKKRVELLEQHIVDVSSEFGPIRRAIDELFKRIG